MVKIAAAMAGIEEIVSADADTTAAASGDGKYPIKTAMKTMEKRAAQTKRLARVLHKTIPAIPEAVRNRTCHGTVRGNAYAPVPAAAAMAAHGRRNSLAEDDI